MDTNFDETRGPLPIDIVVNTVNEFIEPTTLLSLGVEFFPGKKQRHVKYLIEAICQRGRLELFSPCCADQIRGIGSITDLGTGPGEKNMQYLETFPGVAEFFMSRGIPVYYAMMYSDIDPDAVFRLEKLGMTREEYISRMALSSQEMFKLFMGELNQRGFFDNSAFAGFDTFLMRKDGFYTDDNLQQAREEALQIPSGSVRGVMIDRFETLRKWIENGNLGPIAFDQKMVEIATVYLIETMTLGKGVKDRGGVLLSLDAPIMAPYYKVPVLRIPKVK